jgi:hypothetical protein
LRPVGVRGDRDGRHPQHRRAVRDGHESALILACACHRERVSLAQRLFMSSPRSM